MLKIKITVIFEYLSDGDYYFRSGGHRGLTRAILVGRLRGAVSSRTSTYYLYSCLQLHSRHNVIYFIRYYVNERIILLSIQIILPLENVWTCTCHRNCVYIISFKHTNLYTIKCTEKNCVCVNFT